MLAQAGPRRAAEGRPGGAGTRRRRSAGRSGTALRNVSPSAPRCARCVVPRPAASPARGLEAPAQARRGPGSAASGWRAELREVSAFDDGAPFPACLLPGGKAPAVDAVAEGAMDNEAGPRDERLDGLRQADAAAPQARIAPSSGAARHFLPQAGGGFTCPACGGTTRRIADAGGKTRRPAALPMVRAPDGTRRRDTECR